MKWLMLMLTLAFRKFGTRAPSLKETALEIFEEVSHKSRRLVSLTLTGIAAVIFFCGGIFISIVNATTQYDNNGEIYLTATLSGGLILIAIAAITFGLVFLRAWPGVAQERRKPNTEEASARGSSLEQALSALIMDFIKDREMRREESGSASRKRQESTHREGTSDQETSAPIH